MVGYFVRSLVSRANYEMHAFGFGTYGVATAGEEVTHLRPVPIVESNPDNKQLTLKPVTQEYQRYVWCHQLI